MLLIVLVTRLVINPELTPNHLVSDLVGNDQFSTRQEKKASDSREKKQLYT